MRALLRTFLFCCIGGTLLPSPLVAGAREDLGTGDCEGIVPGGLPESRTVVTPHPEGAVCGYVTVDGEGHVATESSGGGLLMYSWYVFGRDADLVGSFRAMLTLMPQPSGFHGLEFELIDPIIGYHIYHSRFDPDGTQQTRINVAGEFCTVQFERILGGGSQLLRECGSVGGFLGLFKFDEAGQLIGTVGIPDQLIHPVGAVDLNGLNLLLFPDARSLGFEPDDFVARWYDPDGIPVSDFFVLFVEPGDHFGQPPLLRPLIGGGIVAQAQSGDWVAMAPSGVGISFPTADWLAPYSNYDIEIVRGGRAYALIPKYPVPDRSTIPLYSASGVRCGAVTFPLPNVTVGMDGTAISSTGDDACTITWWPQLLP